MPQKPLSARKPGTTSRVIGPANMEAEYAQREGNMGSCGGTGDSKSAHVMRMYALAQMLAAAETAVLTGKNQQAAEALCVLQAHAEKFVGLLAPEKRFQPNLVAA